MKPLSDPISFRSHFLPTSPLIALDRNYKPEAGKEIEDLYLLHHEYMHYEDFTLWPCSSMSYIHATHKSIELLVKYKKQKNNEPYTERSSLLSLSNIIPFSTDLKLQNDSFSISGKIGIDLLIESSAILDHLLKNDSDLTNYSRGMALSLATGKIQEANLVHSTGVRLMLEATENITSKPEFNKKLKDYGSVSETLPALLPGLITGNTFGYALIQCGFKKTKYKWKDVFSFILKYFREVESTYTFLLNKTLSDVFINQRYENLVEMIDDDLRDLSVIGYHCYFYVQYLLSLQFIEGYFANDTMLQHVFHQPLLSILKHYEACNSPTLIKYGAEKIIPKWIPIPVILYNEKMLTSMRLKADSQETFFLWGGLETRQDFINFFSWFKMSFMRSLTDSLGRDDRNVTCPIFDWSKKVSVDDVSSEVFLTKLCNKHMRVNFEINSTSKVKLTPSDDFCRFLLTDAKNNKSCLFHKSMQRFCHE